MTSAKPMIGAALTLFALSFPAFAGEPGPGLKPYAPKPKPHHVQTYEPTTSYSSSYSSSYGSSSSSYATSELNRQSAERLAANPPRTTSYSTSYSSGYSQNVPPKYTYSQQPTYVQPAPTYYPAPTPNCGYQPTVCPTGPAPVYHPAPTYQPAPAPYPTGYQPAPYGHNWLNVDPCGDKTIRRLKDTRKGERRYEVCYADLMQLSAYERNERLLDRIELASKKACRDTSFAFYARRASRKCESEATEDAAYNVRIAGFADFYRAKMGIRRPDIHVGAPIYY